MTLNSPCHFYFVRHGETEGNARNLCQGHVDFPLTERGIEQALEAGSVLEGYAIKRVCSSPLGRAVCTAEILRAKLGLADPEILHDLIERDWGVLDGQPNDKMFEREADEERIPSHELPSIQGLELREQFLTRVRRALTTICQTGGALVVGHGRFFRGLCSVTGQPLEQQVPNCAPILCSLANGSWSFSRLMPMKRAEG